MWQGEFYIMYCTSTNVLLFCLSHILHNGCTYVFIRLSACYDTTLTIGSVGIKQIYSSSLKDNSSFIYLFLLFLFINMGF